MRNRLFLALYLGVTTTLAHAQPYDPKVTETFFAFIDAVKRGNEDEVKRFLRGGLKGDSVPIGWPSALHEAAGLGHIPILRILLPGSNPNVRDVCGETPMHYAAAKGQLEAVTVLLAAGGDSNSRSPNKSDCTMPVASPGDSPLSAAVRGGYHDVMRELVTANADLRLPNRKGETPLFLAVQRNDSEAVEFLLGHGADPHTADANGRTPLAQAAANGNAELTKLLLKLQVNYDIPDFKGVTPLMLAAARPSSATVRALLAAGADPYVEDVSPPRQFPNPEQNRSVLEYAIQGGDAEVVGQILDSRLARRRPYYFEGDRAILYGASVSNPAVLRKLIEKGANAKALGECERTGLMNAAETGDVEKVRVLLAAGAEFTFEKRDSVSGCTGTTPLIIAARAGHFAVMEALLDAQSGVRWRDMEGLNAIDVVRRWLSIPTGETQPDPKTIAARAVLGRMRKLAQAEGTPYGWAESPEFLSEPALTAIQNHSAAREGDFSPRATAGVAHSRPRRRRSATDRAPALRSFVARRRSR